MEYAGIDLAGVKDEGDFARKVGSARWAKGQDKGGRLHPNTKAALLDYGKEYNFEFAVKRRKEEITVRSKLRREAIPQVAPRTKIKSSHGAIIMRNSITKGGRTFEVWRDKRGRFVKRPRS